MAKLLHDFEEFIKNDTYFVFDDFDHYVTADTFTTTATNSGTVAVSDGAAGIVRLTPSDGTVADNDETYMHGTTELFKFATDKPMIFTAKVRPVSTTIAETNLIIGLKDAVAADSVLDDGGGPAASYSGALFAKLDGGTKWVCETSVSTSQTTVTSDHVVGNNAWDVLVIETKPISSTVTEVHFYTADVQSDGSFSLADVGKTTAGTQFVAQTITHTSATEMEICFGVKNGAITNSNLLDVDWVYCAQKR